MTKFAKPNSSVAAHAASSARLWPPSGMTTHFLRFSQSPVAFSMMLKAKASFGIQTRIDKMAKARSKAYALIWSQGRTARSASHQKIGSQQMANMVPLAGQHCRTPRSMLMYHHTSPRRKMSAIVSA
eukprot:4794976-Heterocapsa_arctica.AAC.1